MLQQRITTITTLVNNWKQNQIITIHASLQIEGNSLTEQQITAIVENKRVVGPSKDIKEVQNAIKVYEALTDYKFHSINSFLKENFPE